MINLAFKNKGGDSGDRTPSLNVSDLVSAGFLGKKDKLKQGDRFLLKLVNSGSIVSDVEFYVNRKTADTLKADGWNDYLFPLPTNGRELRIGVCGFTRLGGQTATQAAQSSSLSTDRSAYSGISALQRLVAQHGTKVAAAASIGVSVDTLRRMFKKAEAEALAASAKRVSKKSSKKTSGRYGSQKKASTAKSSARSSGLTFTNSYGDKVTLSDLKSALKSTSGNKTAAADYLNTNPRTLGRWLEKAGLA